MQCQYKSIEKSIPTSCFWSSAERSQGPEPQGKFVTDSLSVLWGAMLIWGLMGSLKGDFVLLTFQYKLIWKILFSCCACGLSTGHLFAQLPRFHTCELKIRNTVPRKTITKKIIVCAATVYYVQTGWPIINYFQAALALKWTNNIHKIVSYCEYQWYNKCQTMVQL